MATHKLEKRKDLVPERLLRPYIAAQLKRLRRQTSWTQKLIAAELGRTQAQVSRFENGTRQIPADDLGKIARMFQVPIQEFFPSHLWEDLTQEEERILKAFRNNDHSELLILIADKIRI